MKQSKITILDRDNRAGYLKRIVAALLLAAPLGLCSVTVQAQAAAAPLASLPERPTGVFDDPCAPAVAQAYAGTDVRTYDFGQLCRYRDANTRALAQKQHIRLIFLGDSITEGWSSLDPSLFGPSILNRGISGQTTSQMLVRFRQDVVDLHPDIVHILAGTNDIAGNTGPTSIDAIVERITAMVELAQHHHIAVAIASVLPADRYGWRPDLQPAESIKALNARLRDLASRMHCLYVDYYPLLANAAGGMDADLAADGVHPTAKGYARIHALAAALAGSVKAN